MNGAVLICISDRILPVLDSVPPSSCVSALFCRVHSDQATRVGHSPLRPPLHQKGAVSLPVRQLPAQVKADFGTKSRQLAKLKNEAISQRGRIARAAAVPARAGGEVMVRLHAAAHLLRAGLCPDSEARRCRRPN